jgi:hypothetical protein
MKGWLVIGAAVLAGVLIEETVSLEAQNHPWRVGAVGGVALLAAALVLFVFPSRVLIGAAALVFGAWAIGLVAGLDARDHELGYYCRYGAASRAELDACMKRVDTEEIAELDTPAARFARGETSDCGPGSGPYCAEAARENTTE